MVAQEAQSNAERLSQELDLPLWAARQSRRIDEQLRELWKARRMTVIFVTHSTGEAVFLAERAIVLSKRPGRIVADRRLKLKNFEVVRRGEDIYVVAS